VVKEPQFYHLLYKMRTMQIFGTWFEEHWEKLKIVCLAECKSYLIGPYEICPTT